MAQIINHYSSLIFLLPVLALALFALLRGKGARWKQILSVVLVLTAAVIFFLFQPGDSALDAAEAERALLTTGKPKVLYFYSDY